MNKAGRAAWRSLGTDRLWTSAPNEKGHRLFSAYPSSLIGEASPRRSALALFVNDNPFRSSLPSFIRSSTSDPPHRFRRFTWRQSQRKILSTHPYFIRDWNKLREWIIRWCSFRLHGQVWLSHPRESWRTWWRHHHHHGLWPDISNSTVFVVSPGMVDGALLIIQQQIITTLQQITSLHHPASLLESWQWSHGLDHESATVKGKKKVKENITSSIKGACGYTHFPYKRVWLASGTRE